MIPTIHRRQLDVVWRILVHEWTCGKTIKCGDVKADVIIVTCTLCVLRLSSFVMYPNDQVA
jgi:hypothetical protein